MQCIILIYFFSFALGLHVNHMKTFETKYKKCHYVNSMFSNSCPRQPFDGYNNLYEKSYQMELLEFQQKLCSHKHNLLGAITLLFVIIISFINCLC
jgi:hypothetical protein